MLPRAYPWIQLSDGWLLRFNYRGVTNVSASGSIRLRWYGELIEWQEASSALARDAVETWSLAANDLPATRSRGRNFPTVPGGGSW